MNNRLLKFVHFQLSFLSLCVTAAYAQTVPLKYNQFSRSDGLSNNFVNSITEDTRGFMWIGTRSGLNHFDGYTNQFFVNNSEDTASLSTNDISHVISLPNNKILAGTWGKGINLIDAVSKEVKRLGMGSMEAEILVKSMISKNDSIIWVGSYGNGLLEYNLKRDRFRSISTNFKEIDGENDFKFCQDICYHLGKLWICNDRGQLAYLADGSTQIQLLKTPYDQTTSFGKILNVKACKDQMAFANSNGELILYDPKTNKATKKTLFSSKYSNNKIIVFLPKDDKIWAATSSELKYYDLSKNQVIQVVSTNTGDNFENIFHLYSDSRNILWLGTWGQGLKNIPQNPDQITEVSLSNEQISVKGITESEQPNEILLSTSKGIYTYNKVTAKRSRLNFKGELGAVISKESISGVYRYGSELLICTFQNGLYIADKNQVIRPFNFMQTNKNFQYQSITSISKLPNGEIWIGSWTNGALVVHENSSYQQHHYKSDKNNQGLTSNGVFGATLGSDGNVYLGTYNGLSSYNYKTKKFTDYPINTTKKTASGRKISTVRSVLEDESGRFWLASIDGLYVVNPQKTEVTAFFDVKNGLTDDVIYDLKIVAGYVWATTKNGLSRISLKDLSITNFNKNSGLPSNTCNDNALLVCSGGLLYIGVGEQMVFFDPKTLKKEEYKIDFSITNLFINDRMIQAKDGIIEGDIFGKKSIVLDYDQNNLSFEVSIKDYLTQSKTRHFVYRISGIDKNWIPYNYGQKIIRYPNLTHGPHQFQFTEILESGQLSDDVFTLDIEIKYPFWEKWWFILIAILSVGLLIYLFIRYRTIAMSRKNKELETKVASRTAEIEESNRRLKIQRRSIQDNVKYASRLQNSLLPKREEINEGFLENFIFFKPRDIVSGDFYWYEKIGSKKILVAADCTGHGVSGAFVSVMGITFLKTIVRTMKVTNPSFILNMLHHQMNKSFNEENGKIKDGMDISIMCYDEDTKVLHIASAMNCLLIVNEDKSFERLRGDKFPVGGEDETYKGIGKYTLHTREIHQKQKIYLYSDGFQDQFGGESGSKFMSTRFRRLLVENSGLSMAHQSQIIQNTFDHWSAGHHQVDDVLVVGVCLDPYA